MAGMRGIFLGADSENEEQLQKRLEMVNWGRNFNSLTFLDKDDDYTQHGFSGLGGLSDILQQNMWQIAAAMEMQGILFGDLKGGFSADTEALERYDETIQGRCESYCRKPFTKLLTYIYLMNGISEKPKFKFNSLIANKINEKKMQSTSDFIGLCSRLLADGVLTTKLYAKAVQNFVDNGTVDFGLTEDEIDKLDDDFANQMENINLDEDKQSMNTSLKSLTVK